MTVIFNLTQHAPTAEQIAAGVVELPKESWEFIREMLNFNTLPSVEDLNARAMAIADELRDIGGVDAVMIGGAPFFMPFLEKWLRSQCRIGYAFSERVSEEQVQPDGSTRKVAVFRHLGFVWIND